MTRAVCAAAGDLTISDDYHTRKIVLSQRQRTNTDSSIVAFLTNTNEVHIIGVLSRTGLLLNHYDITS